MKALCIKSGKWWSVIEEKNHSEGPKYGEIVTASQCPVHADSYYLAEYPTCLGRQTSWSKRFFIPLSTIDETTFERNYNKETA